MCLQFRNDFLHRWHLELNIATYVDVCRCSKYVMLFIDGV